MDSQFALQVLYPLGRCYKMVDKHFQAAFLDKDLTVSKFGILDILHHKGRVSLQEIAGTLNSSNGNITWIADALERSGLVRRVRSTADRRVVFLELTAEGRTRYRELIPFYEQTVVDMLSVLTPDEAAVLSRLLKKFGRALQERHEPGRVKAAG